LHKDRFFRPKAQYLLAFQPAFSAIRLEKKNFVD